MPDFRRAEALAVVEFAVHHERAADAAADVHVAEMPGSPARAQAILRPAGRVAVIGHDGWQAEALLEPRPERHPVPAAHLVRDQHRAGGRFDRAAKSNAHARHGPPARRGLREKPGHGLFKPRQDGLRAFARRRPAPLLRQNLPGRRAERGLEFRAPDFDAKRKAIHDHTSPCSAVRRCRMARSTSRRTTL